MQFSQYLEDCLGAKILAWKDLGKVGQIQADSGFYGLKWWQGEKADLELLVCATGHLAENGFSFMAKPLTVGLWEGKSFYLMPWLLGPKADFSVPKQRFLAIKTLAKLHKAGEGFMPPEHLRNRRNKIDKWPELLAERLNEIINFNLRAARGQDDFDRLYARVSLKAIKNAKRALKLLTKDSYSEYINYIKELSPICHGDFVWHNLIINGRKCFILDFDNMMRSSRILDLARLTRTGPYYCRWPQEGAMAGLNCYNHAYPLTFEEREYLWAFMEFPHNVWRLGHNWYVRKKRKAQTFKALSLEAQFLDEQAPVKLI